MDVRFINPFITAVKTVFKTMLNEDLLISKPCLKEPDAPAADVSAVIGFSGDAVGSVILCFPMKTAINTASKFAGMEMAADNEDFADALGELANMVAGQAKAQFEGLSVTISLPSVIIGKNHQVSQSRLTPRLELPCESQLGRFSLEVAMVVEKKQEAVAAAAGQGE
jgi:chemotaxis protein CheX